VGREEGRELKSLGGHAAAISAVAFSADGRKLASCAMDGKIQVWTTVTSSALVRRRRRPPN
jgi:WD40 repeat protein